MEELFIKLLSEIHLNNLSGLVMRKMKSKFSALLLTMLVATLVWLVWLVCAANNEFDESGAHNPVYYVMPYKDEPSQWYSPEELAIIDYLDNDGNFDNGFWIVVDKSKEPFDLQAENPIFKLNEGFYQVSSLWVTPKVVERSLDTAVVGGAVGISIGWFATGMMYYKWRKV
ncbi:MAG: hypothetical protein QXP16_07005 [Candidatus Bathyarchaeia archaeon]